MHFLQSLSLFFFLLFTLSDSVVQVSDDGGDTMQLFATYGDELVLRGVVNSADPSILVDEFSILISDIMNSFGSTTEEEEDPIKVFKAGLNTGEVEFHQISTKKSISFDIAEPDLGLISWHKTRNLQLDSAVHSRTRAMYGSPYKFLQHFKEDGIRFNVIIEDVFDGDEAERTELGDVPHISLLKNSVLDTDSLVIRHVYNESNGVSIARTERYKRLFGASVILFITNHPMHQLIVSKRGISCDQVSVSLETDVSVSCHNA